MEQEDEVVDNISSECRRLYFHLVTFLGKHRQFLRSGSAAELLAQVKEDYEELFFQKEKEAVEAGVWERCEVFFDNLYFQLEKEFQEFQEF